MSPTQFHNSVHNAAAGYWSIAHGSRQPATCLGAHDWTWAAALLKAVAEVAATGAPVLLVLLRLSAAAAAGRAAADGRRVRGRAGAGAG